MYYTMKEQTEQFIWDDEEEIMYQVEDGGVTIIPARLQGLIKFRPHLRLVETAEETPQVLKDVLPLSDQKYKEEGLML